MAKLLQTNLPLSQEQQVDSNLYNRLVRILEINLGAFDPVDTESLSTEERDKVNFNDGSIIFNTTTNKLQVWITSGWYNINIESESTKGLQAQSSLGAISVATNGAINVEV